VTVPAGSGRGIETPVRRFAPPKTASAQLDTDSPVGPHRSPPPHPGGGCTPRGWSRHRLTTGHRPGGQSLRHGVGRMPQHDARGRASRAGRAQRGRRGAPVRRV